MRRRKFIALTTEQDIETACQSLDRRERDALQELGTRSWSATTTSVLSCSERGRWCRRCRLIHTAAVV
jgi:hypothetical protein